jgi:AcrR family transcriptional regulator
MSEPVTPRRRGTRKATDTRRAELVRAAYDRIASHGFEGLRTRDVASEVGVNIATLHYYFPTKEALIKGVLGHALQQFATTLPREGAPAEQLELHLNALSEVAKNEPQLRAVMAELALRTLRDPAIATLVHDMERRWTLALRGLIRRAVEQGVMAPELDVNGAAALIVTVMHGLCLPMDEAGRAARVDLTFREIKRALGMTPSRRRVQRRPA